MAEDSSIMGQVVVAVDTGGTGATDTVAGVTYVADASSSPPSTRTGSSVMKTTSSSIAGTGVSSLYQSYRYGDQFGYNVDLANGTYALELNFVETYWKAANKRRFDVHVEGREVISDLDLFAVAGFNRAYSVTQTVTISDGRLNLNLESGGSDDLDRAILSGFSLRRLDTTPADTTGPLVSASALNLHEASTTHTVTVTYDDLSGILLSSIDVGDILIGGGPNAVTVAAVTTQVNGTQTVARYSLASGADGFTTADSGSYTVSLKSGAVADTLGNLTAAAAIASFTVAIPAAPSTVEPNHLYLTWDQDPATTVTVLWQTTNAVPSDVQFRVLGASDWQAAAGTVRTTGTVGTLHQATITGLSSETDLEYRVRTDGGGWSAVQAAHTGPGDDDAFDFVFFGDTGLIGRTDGLTTGTAQAIATMDALNPDFVLGGGDYAYFNTDKRFGTLDATIDAWFTQMNPLLSGAPYMPVLGNHEVLLGESGSTWASRVPMPATSNAPRTYSFDVGDIHFVAIEAVNDGSSLASAQVDWVRNDIMAAWGNGAKWVIPYMHVSAYADGSSHPSNLAMREQLAPLFDALGVKLVIAAHDQSYERTLPLEGIADRIVPTTQDLTDYSADRDGIVWLKVSPAGKLSNKGEDFSKFQTNPAPAYTAVRDDTHHHVAQVLVDADDNITVRIWAFDGDGKPAFVLDEFKYDLGAGPVPPAPDASAPAATATVSDILANTATWNVQVTYTDVGMGVRPASIDLKDLTVSGPTTITVTDVTKHANIDGSVIATYTLSSLDGFTSNDNGRYILKLAAGGVLDLAGNKIPAADLASFNIAVGSQPPDPDPDPDPAINRIVGTSGSDNLVGTAGDDIIIGGPGRDTLTGRGGSDIFVFRQGDSGAGSANRDVIKDFQTDLDTIDLTAFGPGAQITIGGSGNNKLLYIDIPGDGLPQVQVTVQTTAGLSMGDLLL
jgi:hypothetical protein